MLSSMSLKIFMVFLVLLSISFVAAEFFKEGENINLDTFLNKITGVEKYLQENEVQIPASAEKIIENGNISLNISRTSGSVESIYLTVEEKRVTHISKNFPEKSAYDVFTDEEAINEIINSEDISATILDLYHQGKIKVEANGFGNNIKLFFAKIFLNFA